MRSQHRIRCFLVAALLLTAACAAHAAALRSTARNQRNAVMEHSGFFLTPVGTEPEGEGDLAPPQLFELVRPNDQPITIGRLYTSCVCVALEAEKSSYAQDEKVVFARRGMGLVVAPEAREYCHKNRKALFVEKFRKFLAEAVQSRLSREEIREIVDFTPLPGAAKENGESD